MKHNFLRIFNISGILLSLGVPALSFASIGTAPAIYINNTSQLRSGLFCPIINTMFYILISLAVIMVMWAAYLYVTAGDNTEKVHRATLTITYAAVAIIVALVAYGFPSLISSIFKQTSDFSCS